ncbi:energy transducer TonB [Ekhidna sp.]|uniref:energy transducer TonB n=1 Tax=Ekhidna sp. TaxID=2608089 RepID=UPI003B50217B
MKAPLTILLVISNISMTFGQELALNDVHIGKPYTIVDEPAQFPGGVYKMHDFLRKEMNYPEEALKENVSGRVFVQYIVEKDGSLTNIQVVKKLGFGLDEEAIRLYASMPKWTPGKIDSKPVRQLMIFYVLFEKEFGNSN